MLQTLHYVTLLGSLLIWSALPGDGCSPQKADKAVFVCNMNALTPDERARLTKEIVPSLLTSNHTSKELRNGFEIKFVDGVRMLPDVCSWISMEGRCCPFFDLSINSKGNGGAVTVRITGAPGVKDFIADDLPNLFKAGSRRQSTVIK